MDKVQFKARVYPPPDAPLAGNGGQRLAQPDDAPKDTAPPDAPPVSAKPLIAVCCIGCWLIGCWLLAFGARWQMPLTGILCAVWSAACIAAAVKIRREA